MRKIEREMIDAISRGVSWRLSNTEVIRECSPERGWLTKVELHGNLIATFSERGLELHFGTWQHFSRTTFSRLNALTREFLNGDGGVYQRKNTPYIHSGGREFELEAGDTYAFFLPEAWL